MGPEGFVSSLSDFVVISSELVVNKPLHDRRERSASLSIARAEMATIISGLQVAQALRSKVSPATNGAFAPGDHERLFEEKVNFWCGPVRVVRTCDKEVTLSDGMKTVTHGLSQAIPLQSALHDRDLKSFFLDCNYICSYTPQGYFRQRR